MLLCYSVATSYGPYTFNEHAEFPKKRDLPQPLMRRDDYMYMGVKITDMDYLPFRNAIANTTDTHCACVRPDCTCPPDKPCECPTCACPPWMGEYYIGARPDPPDVLEKPFHRMDEEVLGPDSCRSFCFRVCYWRLRCAYNTYDPMVVAEIVRKFIIYKIDDDVALTGDGTAWTQMTNALISFRNLPYGCKLNALAKHRVGFPILWYQFEKFCRQLNPDITLVDIRAEFCAFMTQNTYMPDSVCSGKISLATHGLYSGGAAGTIEAMYKQLYHSNYGALLRAQQMVGTALKPHVLELYNKLYHQARAYLASFVIAHPDVPEEDIPSPDQLAVSVIHMSMLDMELSETDLNEVCRTNCQLVSLEEHTDFATIGAQMCLEYWQTVPYDEYLKQADVALTSGNTGKALAEARTKASPYKKSRGRKFKAPVSSAAQPVVVIDDDGSSGTDQSDKLKKLEARMGGSSTLVATMQPLSDEDVQRSQPVTPEPPKGGKSATKRKHVQPQPSVVFFDDEDEEEEKIVEEEDEEEEVQPKVQKVDETVKEKKKEKKDKKDKKDKKEKKKEKKDKKKRDETKEERKARKEKEKQLAQQHLQMLASLQQMKGFYMKKAKKEGLLLSKDDVSSDSD